MPNLLSSWTAKSVLITFINCDSRIVPFVTKMQNCILFYPRNGIYIWLQQTVGHCAILWALSHLAAVSGQRLWSVDNLILEITNNVADKSYGINNLSEGILDVSLRLERWQDSSCHSVTKIRLTSLRSKSSKLFFPSDAFNTHNWMHTKSSDKTQTALGLWKDGGLMKNR